jgi:hypothetical protein
VNLASPPPLLARVLSGAAGYARLLAAADENCVAPVRLVDVAVAEDDAIARRLSLEWPLPNHFWKVPFAVPGMQACWLGLMKTASLGPTRFAWGVFEIWLPFVDAFRTFALVSVRVEACFWLKLNGLAPLVGSSTLRWNESAALAPKLSTIAHEPRRTAVVKQGGFSPLATSAPRNKLRTPMGSAFNSVRGLLPSLPPTALRTPNHSARSPPFCSLCEAP